MIKPVTPRFSHRLYDSLVLVGFHTRQVLSFIPISILDYSEYDERKGSIVSIVSV
jgi:hypothetical protein